MRQSWRDLLFAHWPVDAAALRPLVPPQLTLEEHGGTVAAAAGISLPDDAPLLHFSGRQDVVVWLPRLLDQRGVAEA